MHVNGLRVIVSLEKRGLKTVQTDQTNAFEVITQSLHSLYCHLLRCFAIDAIVATGRVDAFLVAAARPKSQLRFALINIWRAQREMIRFS